MKRQTKAFPKLHEALYKTQFHTIQWAIEDDYPQKKGNSTTFCKVLKYSLSRTATNNVTVEAKADISNYR